MTAIQRDEVMDELEAECSCAREVLAAMQAQRDLARDCAAALEAEAAALRVLLRHYWLPTMPFVGLSAVAAALRDYAETGTVSADAHAFASRLSGGEG